MQRIYFCNVYFYIYNKLEVIRLLMHPSLHVHVQHQITGNSSRKMPPYFKRQTQLPYMSWVSRFYSLNHAFAGFQSQWTSRSKTLMFEDYLNSNSLKPNSRTSPAVRLLMVATSVVRVVTGMPWISTPPATSLNMIGLEKTSTGSFGGLEQRRQAWFEQVCICQSGPGSEIQKGS